MTIHSWQSQEAKARFAEVIRKAIEEGDQIIKNRGEDVAVIISKERYDSLTTPKNSLLSFFYAAPYSEVDLNITRSGELPREIEL